MPTLQSKLVSNFLLAAILSLCSHSTANGETADTNQTDKDQEVTKSTLENSEAPVIQEYKNGKPVQKTKLVRVEHRQVKIKGKNPVIITELEETKSLGNANSAKRQSSDQVKNKLRTQQNKDRFPVLYDAVPPEQWKKLHSKD